jgi:hypothetical protein
MSTTALQQAQAACPLVANPYKKKLVKAIARWIERSGRKWAIQRCKQAVEYLLKLRAGEEVSRPQWYRAEYFKYAERIAVKGSFSKFSQVVQLWRVFTAVEVNISDPSKEDIEKFENAASKSSEGELTKTGATASPFYEIPWGSISRRRVQACLPEVNLPRFIEVRNPLALRAHGDDGKLTEMWADLVVNSWTLIRVRERWGITQEKWPYALRQIPWLPVELPGRPPTPFGCIGHVFCTMQRDGKARFFLSPPDWVQFLLEPWARSLYRALRKIPQDCTYDQEAGARRVMWWIKEGKKVYSFDLSSATDRFPLGLTRTVLKGLSHSANMKMWVDTFSVLARIPAAVGYNGSRTQRIMWRVGQPLGVIASFAAFALSHHALVRGLWEGDPSEAPYVILGDDIVIADEGLAMKYRRVITQLLGVDISEQKSLQGRLGEFAGRFIESQGYALKLKWFHVNRSTLLSMVNLIGPRAVKAMSSKDPLRNVLALIPTPRTPSGFNPGGFPRDKVHAFQTAYIAAGLEERSYSAGEPIVDSETAVASRDSMLRAISEDLRPWYSPPRRGPQGSAKIGFGGAPEFYLFKSRKRDQKHYSQSWLRKVVDIAKQCQLLPPEFSLRKKRCAPQRQVAQRP